ncbi:hypothetical protein RJ641_015775 [Dillenia turbinata]|uniref:Nuclear pore complex protein NUP214 n=1 Tax=Dillenia turbinata TaxID=194707 RepID=A0AAN8UY98_9MAGN
MASSRADNAIVRLQLDDELEGERVATVDYFFDRIGASVPVFSDKDSQFDLQTSPTQPLVVSERFQVLFIAHSDGFFVAKTKDAIESAKAIKQKGHGSSIQDLSVVEVAIGRVHILELSTDSSTLAASVGPHIHFFSVSSLLNKEEKPFLSCSLDDSTTVKDLRWIKKMENSYIVLTSEGKLYLGSTEGHPKYIMDNVDAVDWNITGDLVAVARKNMLSIVSTKFEEKSCLTLLFKTWTNESDDKTVVKVDSVRWVRRDSIIVGSFQLTEDGTEESYLVQIITSKDGKDIDASNKPVVLSFSDVYPDVLDDSVPFGSGPEIAITANRKNVDQHIALFGWSVDDENKDAMMLEFGLDKWNPRIELQDNGDDNFVLGLCVDNVSVYEKVKVTVGTEDPRELWPYCVLLCLTCDGKLCVFHVAGNKEAPVSTKAASSLSNVAKGSCPVGQQSSELLTVTSELREQQVEQVALRLPSKELDNKELNLNESGTVSIKNISMPSELSTSLKASSIADQTFPKAITTLVQKEALINSRTVEGGPGTNSELINGEAANMLQPSLNTFGERSSPAISDFSKIETQGTAGVGSSSESSMMGAATDASVLTYNRGLHEFSEASKNFIGNIKPSISQIGSTQALFGGEVTLAKDDDARPLFSPSLYGRKSEDTSVEGAGNASVVPAGKLFNLKSGSGSLAPAFASSRTVQRGGQRDSREGLQAARNSHSVGRHIKEDSAETPAVMLNTEPNLSKKFGNVKEMVKELDTLLECIEKEGGFRDACTVNQRNSLLALDQGVDALSDRCSIWKSLMSEHLGKIQHLLDKTVQVLARKIYLDGMVKQASDVQYWDLWAQQKLSSELALKRDHVLEISQNLTKQLVELERHFNAFEMNKFGENEGTVSLGASRKSSGPSRHMQSLHSLQNTMSSQLAAAEQLSECLSTQMSLLSIKSPPTRQQNVKKELFDTIGIPYHGVSFNSPDVWKSSDMPSIKNLPFLSYSATVKDHSNRKQASVTKNNESETTRRRRDSLDRSWASFEPQKTVVKRILLEDSQKARVDESSSVMWRQHSSTRMLEGSLFRQTKNLLSPSNSISSKSKGIQNIPTQQASQASTFLITQPNDVLGTSPSVPLKAPAIEFTPTGNLSAFSLQSSSKPSSHVGQIGTREISNANAKRSSISETASENSISISINGEKTMLLSETQPHLAPSASVRTLAQSPPLMKINTETPSSHGKASQLDTATSNIQLSDKVSLSPAFSAPHSNSSPLLTATRKTQPGDKVSSSPTFSIPHSNISSPLTSASLPSLPTPTTATLAPIPFGNFLNSSKATADVNKTSTLPSSSSISSGSLSFKAPHTVVSQSSPITSEPVNYDKEPSLETQIISTTQAPPAQPGPATSGIMLKQEAVEPSTANVSAGLSFGSQPSFNISMVASGMTSSTKQEQQHAASILLPTPLSFTGSAVSSDPAPTQEDSMEEEAPETNCTPDLGLGSLSGFGIGSAPSITAPKSNPFGGPFINAANTASSSFTMTVPTGQLFRPASFSFQPPQSSQTPQQVNLGFSGGFTSGSNSQAQASSGFGQPAQIGQGQQALGSVLGSFGQSRQIGFGLPGAGFSSGSSFSSGGFTGTQSNASGFANVSSTGSAFASLASAGGFAGSASGVGGFAGAASGGFSAAGGGFGAFSNQQGGGGFSAFSGNAGGTGRPPSELFTQMRR